MTEPLRRFLLDAIAEDERIALAADGPHWIPGDGNISEGGLYAIDGGGRDPHDGWAIAWFELGWTNQKDDGTIHLLAYPNWERHAHQNSVHAATWDPARVLLHCRMLRRIIEVTPPVRHYTPFEREWLWCPKARKGPLGDLPGGPDAECECGADELLAHGGPLILQILAQPLADRPGFRPEWKRYG